MIVTRPLCNFVYNMAQKLRYEKVELEAENAALKRWIAGSGLEKQVIDPETAQARPDCPQMH